MSLYFRTIYRRCNNTQSVFREKKKATGFVCLQGSPYHDAEGSSQLRSCLHDSTINSAPITGQIIYKLELYRQCHPIRVKDKNMTELGQCDCVSYVMTITPILKLMEKK